MTHDAATALRSLHLSRTDRLAPAGLVVLTLVPAVAGMVRLSQLALGESDAESARFFDDPLPAVAHIVSALGFCLVGAFQFSPRLRRRAWHRAAGRALAPLGIVAALSGLWMTWVYPPADLDGPVLFGIRQLVGVAMIGFIALALFAVRRRDFAAHGAWMTRGYALGIGAGTQVFTHLPLLASAALQTEGGRALAMGAGWAINLAVAEWLIRRRAAGA